MKKMRRFTYVPDTSVLVSNPKLPYELGLRHKPGACHIVIPAAVIRELDGIKKDMKTFKGKAARYVARMLDRFSSYADLIAGVQLSTGGILHTSYEYDYINELASDADNKIVGTAIKLKRENGGTVIVLTTDGNMRTISRMHGLKGEFYPFGFASDKTVEAKRRAEIEEVRKQAQLSNSKDIANSEYDLRKVFIFIMTILTVLGLTIWFAIR